MKMTDKFTCITCQVMFKTPELQREHYKLDWHRYNLKRKVASIPPVTLEEFELRAKEHRESQNANQDESQYCKYCSKLFNNMNSYCNHLNSKKHKISEEKYATIGKDEENRNSDSDSYVKVEPTGTSQNQGKFVVVNADNSGEDDIETDSEIEEVIIFVHYFLLFYFLPCLICNVEYLCLSCLSFYCFLDVGLIYAQQY